MVADGIYGRNSRRTVTRFQQDLGLTVTGTVDAGLFDRLGVPV
jgi:peptidoglycan hydrolase-like protein with peptidoglycan-binding domain